MAWYRFHQDSQLGRETNESRRGRAHFAVVTKKSSAAATAAAARADLSNEVSQQKPRSHLQPHPTYIYTLTRVVHLRKPRQANHNGCSELSEKSINQKPDLGDLNYTHEPTSHKPWRPRRAGEER